MVYSEGIPILIDQSSIDKDVRDYGGGETCIRCGLGLMASGVTFVGLNGAGDVVQVTC